MAFDCVFVDFQKNKRFKDQILNQFPYARVTPFVVSYYDILKSFVEDIRTEFFWLATDLVDIQSLILITYQNSTSNARYTCGTLRLKQRET